MGKKIALLTLQTFSTTGGIQKMTRTLAHALNQVATRNNWNFRLWSLYDSEKDLMPQYLPAKNFKGFNINRGLFILRSLKLAISSDVVIISHVNLAVVGLIIKIINPKCKVWLIAHGIEVWRQLSYFKKTFLTHSDKIICVSTFTKQETIRWHRINANKCIVLNNTVDPFMKLPLNFNKPNYLLKRYKLDTADVILFTLTRLAATEQYKGYEQTIKIINKLKIKYPTIRYVLAGKSDAVEEDRIRKLITKYRVEDHVILTGFVNENELADHFLIADLFVLPSIKEGFGIVFIEALACGLPVVCGNVDGSLDAIRNGELGKAVNPDDLEELEHTITNCLNNPQNTSTRQNLQNQCLHYFNENDYINRLEDMLHHE
jgi:phosphatidylinositol alpha-1,6-mannosyltransferase